MTTQSKRRRTVKPRPVTDEERREYAIELAIERPRTRGDCIHGPRPCPWVACRYHLYLDVNPRNGNIKRHDADPWEIEHTCAIDVAGDGGLKLEAVGERIDVTRERVRQIVAEAIYKIRQSPIGSRLLDEHLTHGLVDDDEAPPVDLFAPRPVSGGQMNISHQPNPGWEDTRAARLVTYGLREPAWKPNGIGRAPALPVSKAPKPIPDRSGRSWVPGGTS